MPRGSQALPCVSVKSMRGQDGAMRRKLSWMERYFVTRKMRRRKTRWPCILIEAEDG